MDEQWLSVAEAAKVLGISATTVRRRAQREMLESRIGGEGRLEIRLAVTSADAGSGESSEVAAGAEQPAEPASSEAANDTDTDTDTETDADAEVAGASPEAGPSRHKFGRYSPLPHEDVGITPGASGKPTARLTPGDMLGEGGASDAEGAGPDAELRRYQRLAGASMILAQRQADEAHEQVKLLRAESHAWRRWCHGAWAGVAVVMLLAMFVVGVVGHRASSAQAALQAQEQAVETVREAAARSASERDDLQQLVRDLHRQLDRNGNGGRNAAVR